MSRRMKTKIAHIQGALGGWLEHEGVQGWMVVPSAITFPWSRTSGWENSSRCQWWSSLFWIRRVTPEELHSLSKTTKLLLLDSLLQEVCIESGSDGSLALSSLGLSVCLVSHNLLYSGLKKAHSKMKSTKSRANVCGFLLPPSLIPPECFHNFIFSQDDNKLYWIKAKPFSL